LNIDVNAVRDGVIGALKSLHPSLKVYGEEIKQGLVEPCFFVKILTAGQKREINRRYVRSHLFDIHFFSKSNEEHYAMAESLLGGMEYIEVNGRLTRGTAMSYQVIDRVLHFFVNYNFHVLREKQDETKMQNLEQEEIIK